MNIRGETSEPGPFDSKSVMQRTGIMRLELRPSRHRYQRLGGGVPCPESREGQVERWSQKRGDCLVNEINRGLQNTVASLLPCACTFGTGVAVQSLIISTEASAMGSQLELLEAEALQLTAGERAAFAQLLLASLDEDAEIEEAWAAETERRISDIESGAVQVIPIADALAQVRTSLK